MNNIDFDSTELCLIDSGIKSLQKIPLRPQIQVLNLHSNFIHRIENLFYLRNLKHLDLSANQISKIEGFENLTNLRTINLSCNHLSDVRGLNGLRCEVKLFYETKCIWFIIGERVLTVFCNACDIAVIQIYI